MKVRELNPKIKMTFSDKIVISEGGGSDYEQGYADGYKQGESEGYTNGLNDGYADGYNDGYQWGKTEGYNEGYGKGMQEGNIEGYDRGYAYGYEQGYSEGYSKGFEDGKAQGYTEGETKGIEQGKSDIWQAIQDGGNRTDYRTMFNSPLWDNETFKPIYDMTPTIAQNMFYGCKIGGDLVSILEELGVKLDFSKCNNFSSTFQNCSDITRLGVIDFSGAAGVASWQIGNTIYNCPNLVTIDKIIVNEELPNFSSTINSCPELVNLTFEGVIAKNGLNLSKSTKLSRDSLMSVLNCLKDFSTDTSGTSHTVTLGTTNLAKLTDAEKAIATQKNWTLA
jgi:hypothetical protein